MQYLMNEEEYLELAKQRLLVSSLVGSHAYGTSHENSDKDIRGIFVGDPVYLASPFVHFPTHTVTDPGDEDTVYWELGKFLQKAPTGAGMIDILFAKDMEVHPLGKQMLGARDLLLTTRMVHSLLGQSSRDLKFMTRQDRVPDYDNPPQPLDFMYQNEGLRKKHHFDSTEGFLVPASGSSIGFQPTAILLHYPVPGYSITNPNGDLVITKPVNATRHIGSTKPRQIYYDNQAYKRHKRSFEMRKSGPGKTSKRHELFEAHGYDTKTAASALRLARMGLELCQTGSYNLHRHDADELKELILEGGREVEDVRREVDSLRKAALDQIGHCPLPEEVDWARVGSLYHRLMEMAASPRKRHETPSLSV